jgi:hypothetical protein
VVSDVRQVEIYTAEPLVPQYSAFDIKMNTERLTSYQSPGTDQIPAELSKT